MDTQSDNSNNRNCRNSSPLFGEGVVLDIGTGDGVFVAQAARLNPRKFYIGIDANARPLEKLSSKMLRKPTKGGLTNALFVQSSVEDLPLELDSVADEIHIHFPWGSLLRAVATGEAQVLKNLRRVAVVEAWLEVVLGLDPVRDRGEIERLGLPDVTVEYIKTTLVERYAAAGWTIIETGVLPETEWAQLNTSWAKRLQGNSARAVVYFMAQATQLA